jgi:hypothetical protein
MAKLRLVFFTVTVIAVFFCKVVQSYIAIIIHVNQQMCTVHIKAQIIHIREHVPAVNRHPQGVIKPRIKIPVHEEREN